MAQISVKHLIFKVLNDNPDENKFSRAFDIFIFILIVTAIISLILQTDNVLDYEGDLYFAFIDWSIITVFTIEFILRLWTCTYIPEYSSPIMGRIKYFFNPLMIIDFISIVPFYLTFITINFVFLRIIRLFCIFIRVLKRTRYSKGLRMIGQSFLNVKEELVLTLFILLTIMLLAATFLYLVEKNANGDAFSSIPNSLYWCILTFTTLGSDHAEPVTVMGKISAAVISIVGIMIFALPTAIFTTAYIEEIQKYKEAQNNGTEPKVCPHCGKSIDE